MGNKVNTKTKLDASTSSFLSVKPTSFFDDDKITQKKIWSKPSKNKEKISQINQILQGVLIKRCKKIGKSKQRLFIVDEDNLYFTKNDKTDKISGVLELNCCKLDILQNVEPKQVDTSLNENLFGFRISRNGKVLELYTKDQAILKKWKNILIYKAIQQSFHEDFVVTKMIGKGSFAKVYLATKKDGQQQYAIKAFNKEFMASQHKGKESLINEIGVMRNLRSEHLINLYEVYETANSIYFVLDILNGGELLNRVRDKTMNEVDLKLLMRNLLLGLQYLHSKNIMHRDLKPENLLLKSKDNDYDLVVADLGLATFTHIKDILFKRCGTPGFVAPEVLAFNEGDPLYDVKCDIFSAGVIFYLLLTGKQPFEGKDYKQILRANKACEIQFDIPELQHISQNAKDLLILMLKASPLERPSATECLDHPFISNNNQKSSQMLSGAQQNLRNYDVDFKANVIKKQNDVDSQEQIGSLALHTNGSPAMNGCTDTVGSLSTYSNPNLQAKGNEQHQPLTSKFSTRQKADSIDQNMLKNQQGNVDSPKNQKQQNNNNLHKLAIKNNMNK